jgi:hypothetical protein
MTESNPAFIDIDPARRCMLVERVADVFNDIMMVSPVQRVVLVGKGVQQAAMNNEAIKTMIGETRFIETLHSQAKFRSTGVATGLPPALMGDLSASKEAQRA